MVNLHASIVFPFGHRFHHIGCACTSLEESFKYFSAVGYLQEGSQFIDEIQGVRGCFITGAGPRLELLENLEGRETLTPWISSGIRFYHFAYFVDDINDAIVWAKGRGARVIVRPVASIAFDDNLICFVMFRDGMLMEFIHQPAQI